MMPPTVSNEPEVRSTMNRWQEASMSAVVYPPRPAPPRPTRQSFESYFHKFAAGPWVIARLNWNLNLDTCDGVGKCGGLVLTAGEIGNVVLSSGLYATMRESIGNVESISLCLMGDGG
jgi:hypothetical protein